MTVILIHKDLHTIVKSTLRSSATLQSIYDKIYDAFAGAKNAPNLGSMPLIIMTRDSVSHDATNIPNGRIIILDHFANTGRLEVLDSASVAFHSNDYVTLNLGQMKDASTGQIDEFYSALCNLRTLKTTGNNTHNFDFLIDIVLDAINFHENGGNSSDLMRAEAQFWHEITDVKGFTLSSIDLDEDFRLILTGGNDIADQAFSGSSRDIVVKKPAGINILLKGAVGMGEIGGVTQTTKSTDMFVLSNSEIDKINSLLVRHADGKINDQTLKSNIIEALATGSGGYNRERLAAFKLAQYISVGADQLGSRAKAVLDDSIIINIYKQLSGDAAVKISSIGGSFDKVNRLYMDITPYKSRVMRSMIFGSSITDIDYSKLNDPLYLSRFKEAIADQHLNESLHNIFDSKQSRVTLAGIIDDMMKGKFVAAGLDIETTTDRTLAAKLNKEGLLQSSSDMPIISAGTQDSNRQYTSRLRRLSSKEADIWREHYKTAIAKARKSVVYKSGDKWKLGAAKKKAYGRYLSGGKPILLPYDFGESFSDITKWLGGMYGTDLFSPDSMIGHGIVKDTNIAEAVSRGDFLGTIGSIVQEVKGKDRFATTAEGVAHFMRMSSIGRTELFNEWLIREGRSNIIGGFFDIMETTIEKAIDKLSDPSQTLSSEDFLNAILKNVTDAYNPQDPRAVRLRADVFDVRGIAALYEQVKATSQFGSISVYTEERFRKFMQMERTNVSEVLQSIAAVAKRYNITKTTEDMLIPTSAAIDQLIQSEFLDPEVIRSLIDEGAIWQPGADLKLEPHVGVHDIKLAIAINEQTAKLLNQSVVIEGSQVKLGELVRSTIADTTAIGDTDLKPNLLKISWSDLIEGTNKGEYVYLSRMRTPEITKDTAGFFGIDYRQTYELNKEGNMFSIDRMYPVGGRQTVRVSNIEQYGDDYIVTLYDAVTERSHRIVVNDLQRFEQNLLTMYDVRVSTREDIALDIWEDTVVKSLDEYRRIVDELISGESRTTGRSVNAPKVLRNIFEVRDPIIDRLGIKFWDKYDEYLAGKATPSDMVGILREIDNDIAGQKVVHGRMSAAKILAHARFIREQSFWIDELSRETRDVVESVPLQQERIALLESIVEDFDAANITYKNRGTVDISKISQESENYLRTIIDLLDKKGYLPKSLKPVDNSIVTRDDTINQYIEQAKRSIFPENMDTLQLDQRLGITREAAMAERIRRALTGIFDITDTDFFKDESVISAINNIAKGVTGDISDMGHRSILSFANPGKIDAKEVLNMRLAAAKRIALDDTITRREITPLAQVLRDLMHGSPTSMLEHIDDPAIQEFMRSGELVNYFRDMNTKNLTQFAARFKAIGVPPDSAAPITLSLRQIASEIFGLVDVTNPGAGAEPLPTYVAPTFSPEDIAPIRGYTDDIAEGITKNINPKTILATAAILGTMAVINNAFVDSAPEKNRIKGTGYVTPSGEYIDDPSAVDPTESSISPEAIQGRGFRMRITGINNLVGAHGIASGFGRDGSVTIHNGSRSTVDNTNKKRILDRMI